MDVAYRVTFEERPVRRGRFIEVEFAEPLSSERLIFLFKNSGVLALPVRLVVVTVLVNLVDEKEGQSLDSVTEELPLLVKMRAYNFPDLESALLFVGHIVGNLSSLEHLPIQEGDSVGDGIDLVDDETLVGFDTARNVVQTITLLDLHRL